MRIIKTAYGKDVFDIHYIHEPDVMKKCLRMINKKHDKLGFDIETARRAEFADHDKAGLWPRMSQVRLMQFYGGDDQIYVFDVWELKDLSLFRDVLKKKLIAHNACFEMKFMKFFGENVDHCHCTQIMYDHVARAEQEENYDTPRIALGLGDVAAAELGYRIPKDLQTSNWNAAVLSIQQLQYAALDAVLTYNLAMKMLPRIAKYKLGKAYNCVKDAQKVIAEMEINGMGFDEKAHAKAVKGWIKGTEEKKVQATASFGSCNIGSSAQLSDWAKANLSKSDLSLMTETKSSTREKPRYSFNAKKLVALKHIPAIRDYLEYKKLYGWYTKFGPNLSRHINPTTGNIHPSFWLTGQVTGRMSSSNPNFQQMPNDDTFRKLFVAPEGWSLIGADYSQIEMRLQAECSRDPEMLAVYEEGRDIYTALAARIFDKSETEIAKDSQERKIGKACVLGLGYGMGPSKFGETIFENSGILLTAQEEKKYWNGYHETFHGYSSWCDDIRNRATNTGWTRTRMGRLRKLHPDFVYTTAPNTIIQGTSAQILYNAMDHLHVKELTDLKFIAPIHDELIVMAPTECAKAYAKQLEDSMVAGFLEVFPKGCIRGLVKAKVGKSWGEIH